MGCCQSHCCYLCCKKCHEDHPSYDNFAVAYRNPDAERLKEFKAKVCKRLGIKVPKTEEVDPDADDVDGLLDVNEALTAALHTYANDEETDEAERFAGFLPIRDTRHYTVLIEVAMDVSSGNRSSGVDLKEFYVFNPTFGNDHDDELGKILYYYPSQTHVDTQLKHVGLCEAIIRFSENFSCNRPCEALHTQKARYVFYQPEPNYWFTMVLSVPSVIRMSPDGIQLTEYLDDQVQTNVFQSVLLMLYRKFILRHDTLEGLFRQGGINGLKEAFKKSFQANLNKVQTNHCGIVEMFQGLHFLPVDRHMFLKVQCFTNQLFLTFPQLTYLLLLQGEKLIWTGIGHNDIQVLYEYLLKELLSQHFLSGTDRKTSGFVVKKRSHVSLFELYVPTDTPRQGSESEDVNGTNSDLDDGATSVDSFFTASPSSRVHSRQNSRCTSTVRSVKVHEEKSSRRRFHVLVFKAEQSYMTMFLNDTEELDVNFMINLETFLTLNFSPLAKLLDQDYNHNTSVTGIASSIKGLTSSLHSPSLDSLPPTIKFVYFNNLNLAVKVSPGVQCDLDSYRMLADLKEALAETSESGEIVVKLALDPCAWIVSKVSNGREFYAVFTTKTSNNITDIDEEVKKLTESHLNNIFFQD